MSTPTSDSALRSYYHEESERVRRDFESNGSGRACTQERVQLVDRLLLHLWEQQPALHSNSGFALLALGGFGRRALYPHSDIDLLFLCQNEAQRARAKEPVRAICQELWDIGLRVSPTTRTIDDCGRFDQENVEFTISLLDCRFLVGDDKLFARLHDKSMPQLVARESGVLVQRLTEVTATRHLRYGKTIFHLEPNLKDGPGGLRDFHVTRWIALIEALSANHAWPESLHLQQNSDDDDVLAAMEFLSSARCYLHYRSNRDENVVSWEAQDDLALRGVGSTEGAVSSAEWMRLYFRNAKAICRNASQLLDQTTTSRSNLVRSFRRWRSRTASDEFSLWIGVSTSSSRPVLAMRKRCSACSSSWPATASGSPWKRSVASTMRGVRFATPCLRMDDSGSICASCSFSPMPQRRFAPCILSTCWRWQFPNSKPSIPWYCVICTTATPWTSTPSSPLTRCIGCAATTSNGCSLLPTYSPSWSAPNCSSWHCFSMTPERDSPAPITSIAACKWHSLRWSAWD